MAHNEDDSPETEEQLNIIHLEIENSASILGLFYSDSTISVGFNNYGIGIVGNSLFQTDAKSVFRKYTEL